LSRFVAPSQAMSADEGTQAKVSVKWFNVTKGFGFVAPEDGNGDAFLHISVLNRAGLQQIGDGAELSCMIAPGNKGRQVTRIVEILSEGAQSGGDSKGWDSKGHDSYSGRDHSPRQDNYGSRKESYGQKESFNNRNDSYGGRQDTYNSRQESYSNRNDSYSRQDNAYNDHTAPVSTGPEIEVSGTVKWFKPDKGFGFVAADDGDKDIFIHKSLLRRANIDDLESGQRVKVRATTADKGREATWIALASE
jgi:CspA family cold shock protein